MLVARDGKRALQLAEEIVANGGQAMAFSCDVSDYGSVRSSWMLIARGKGDRDFSPGHDG
jgi:hypothetical protein